MEILCVEVLKSVDAGDTLSLYGSLGSDSTGQPWSGYGHNICVALELSTGIALPNNGCIGPYRNCVITQPVSGGVI